MPVVLKKEDPSTWMNDTKLSNFAFPYEVDLIATKL